MQLSYSTGLENGLWTASAEIRYGRRHLDHPARVWFSSLDELSRDGSFLIPLSVLPAMHRGEDLTLDPAVEVSPALLQNLDRIQTLLLAFGPSFGHRLKRVEVHATPGIVNEPPSSRGVACFFSGGVDSFYSVLRHLDELDALIFIRGFDTRLDNQNGSALEDQTADVRRAAAELGVRLVEVTTNARSEFSDAYLHWELYHGGLMGAIAHLLSPHFHRIYIASSYPYEYQGSCGSHPLLDPLWAPEGLEIVHDGGESDRWHKLEFVSSHPVVQRHLHTCWRNKAGFGNCGECANCVRVMTVLKHLGRLELFSLFPHSFDPSLLGNRGYDTMDEIHVTHTLWRFLKEDPVLGAAVRDNLAESLARFREELYRESAVASSLQ